MAEAEQTQALGKIFAAITVQLASLTKAVNSQGVSDIVKKFSGSPSQFKDWIKSIQRFEILTGADDAKLKNITLQTAEGPVADFVTRWMRDHPNQQWQGLKNELQARFGEITDRSIAFSLLRRVKQERHESVQIYAERLLAIAEDAFDGQDQADLAAIERQLVGFFIDGLAFDYLKMKVMRENPNRLQNAVQTAMEEQNLRRKFNLRTGRDERAHEPMDVDHLRPIRCQICRKLGHDARACRSQRERADAVQMVRSSTRPLDRGNGNGNGRSTTLRCWYCSELGHIRARCERYKAMLRNRGTQEAPARLVNGQGNL